MFWANGIKSVEVRTGGMGSTPAMVGNATGKLFLNVEKLSNLSEDEIHSIISHEQGHILGKTANEFLADAIGFENYAKTGRSLKASYTPLVKFLPFTNDEHIERLKKQTVRALIYDYEHNGNKRALKGIEKIMGNIIPMKNLQNVERI